MRDALKETSRGTVVAIVVVVAVVIVGLVFASMAIFGFGFLSQKTANFRGETQKKNQVEGNGSYRIAAYDHFFDLCADVQTKESAIDALQQELASKPTPDAQRKIVINASITANRIQRASDINTYNQDARKSYTEGQFRSSDLPYQLDKSAKETSCTAS
jgi:hypothetical protein